MQRRIGLILAATCLATACNKPEEAAPAAVAQCGSFGAGAANPGSAASDPKIAEGQVKQQVTASGETADVVNQLSWQLCNARTNAWIDDNFYRKEMSLLRESAFDAFAQRAGRSPQEAAQARQRACLTEAGSDEAAQAAWAFYVARLNGPVAG